MPKFANYFATVSEDGRITLIGDATPAHELLPNQIMLTEKEYYLLRVVKSLDEAKALLRSIDYKIGELKRVSSEQSE